MSMTRDLDLMLNVFVLIFADPVFYIVPKAGHTLSLTDALFPNAGSNIFTNQLLNLTFDCTTKQLDAHIGIANKIEIFPGVLVLTNVVVSLRVTLDTSPAFNTVILSANTQLFSLKTFVAVRYDFAMKKVSIKGLPMDASSLNLQSALAAVSGSSLHVPSGMSALTKVAFFGLEDKDVITIAAKGKSKESTVAVILQKSPNNNAVALIGAVRNFGLASFVNSELGIDIRDLPVFGTLQIPVLGFAASTGKITSPILPLLYATGSPLETFGSTLPKGVAAYFTATIAGVDISASFSVNKFSFKVPTGSSLSVKKLLDQIPNLSGLTSLPSVVADILNSQISGFNFDPNTKQLELSLTLTELTLVPNILKLTDVQFMLSATLGTNPSIQTFKFSGTWNFKTISLNTNVFYDGTNKVLKLRATPKQNGTSLSIDSLLKNVAAIGNSLPSALTSLSLDSIVGNVYSNGNYFIAMSGSVSGGNVYLIFYKGAEGVRVGVAASLQSFQFAKLVESAVGADITSVPYFGTLTIPAMALSVTSGQIKSPALPHLFGQESPLYVYGDTLPAGITSQFNLDIGKLKGAAAKFYNGLLLFSLPDSVDFNIEALTAVIPGVSGALDALPSQIRGILSAKVKMFSFNSTSRDINIKASLSSLTVIDGFLAISDVTISYDGTLGKPVVTRTLDFIGKWQIGDYVILTTLMYDGVSKQLMIGSQSQGGKDLSISNLVQSISGTSIPLPAAISSFAFTGIAGKTAPGITVIVLNGKVGGGNGKISAVFVKTSTETAGAIVVDVMDFKLSELVQSATGVDISGIPFFGALQIPELKFAAATYNITTPILTELVASRSALEWYKGGILQGVSGRFVIQIGDVKVAVNFVHKQLDFKVPDTSSLSLDALLSAMPKIKEILSTVPSQLASVFKAKIAEFSYDPSTNELQFSGSLDKTVDIVPGFVSITNVKISLVVVLGQQKRIETLDFMGEWRLKDLPILTVVRYNRAEDRLDIAGDLNAAEGGVTIPQLITALSGADLSVPSVLSTVKLARLSGNKIGDVVLITLSGSIAGGRVFLLYQKSPSGSVIALAADTPEFRFSTLVSSATGLDISSVPYFGSLVIPQIAFTIASDHITNPLLSAIFPQTSPLAKFGGAIHKGVTASFSLDIAKAKGIVADFAKGTLDLQVPKSVDLSLISILELIPGLQHTIDSLPQTIRDIGSTKLHKLYFVPTTKEFQLMGSLDSLAVIPDFLTLRNIEFEFSGIIGKGSRVEFILFKGDWVINSLALTTEVFYEQGLLLLNGYPAEDKSLNIKDFIKGLTGTDLNVPSALNAIKFTRIIGKIQEGVFSLVLAGEIGTKANVSIIYEKSKAGNVVAFAADIQEFQLAELVKAGTGIDISDVPFFGTLTIPAISFVVSTKPFSTANLPDLNVPGVHIPSELHLENIPGGVKGKFLADIGSALGLVADFSDKVLTIEVPSQVSLSLSNLLAVIPEIKSTIDSLPDTVKDILGAKITKLLFKAATKDLFISLELDTLTLVPDVLSLRQLKISLDVSLAAPKPALREVAVQTFANDQAVTINMLDISAIWDIRGIQIATTVTYDRDTKLFYLKGVANGGNGVSVTEIIKAFSTSSIPVPSVISSLKLTKVVATSSQQTTTVILTATAGNANVYVLYQKTSSASATAVAAEVQSFKIVDLIKTATGIDLTGAPFIGSFVVSTMAFSASTNPITTPLLASTFDPDGPLQMYGDTLPKGVTAHFEVQIGGKTGIAIVYQAKKLQFNLPKNIGLSLSDLLSELPSISSVVNALPPPISDLRTTALLGIDFDIDTRTLSVSATLDKLTIIPDKMLVKSLRVSFVAILSSKGGGLQTLEFTADWVLGSANIRIKVSYDKVTKQVVFAAMPKNGLNIQQLIQALTGSNIPLPSAINSVQLTKIIGRKTPSVSTIIFSGAISDKAAVHLVYQTVGKDSQVGVAAGVKSFTFAELVKSAVNVDISGVPYFGTFSVPSLALSITNKRITSDLFPNTFAGSPLVKYGDTLPKGFTAAFDAPIGKIKGILGSYKDKVILFTVPSSVDASLGSLVSVIPGIDVNSLGIGSVFGDLLSIQLKKFAFDVGKKQLSVELYLQKISFYEDRLSLREVQLRLDAGFSPKSLTVSASGIIGIGKTDFDVSVSRNAKTKKYELSIQTEKLPISDLINEIGASFLPDDLQKILQKVFQFNILNAKIVYPFGAQPQQIQLYGTPQIFGQKTASVVAVAFRYSGKIRLIQKIEFPSFNIADLIEDLVGVSLHKLKLLDQEVNVKFVLSPNTIKGVKLTIPELKGYSLSQGISIKAPLDWPSDCSSDAFCNVANKLLGGVKLSLEGTIANARSFTVTATVGDIKLGGGVVLLRAGMQFVAGANPSVGLVGSIELKDPKITLMAAIRVTVGGVKLEGSMSGCWNNAFGSPYLTICNFFLSMTINPSPLPISGLEFGGRVEVGKKSCGHVLTAEGYVGINFLNVNENFFYADVGPVTFQKFFDAFCIDVTLPKPLGESGFPNGFKTSFSLLGRELPHAGIVIPPGYVFRGTLNIFGLEAYADIYIQLPTRITAKINLPPMSIGGIFKMYRSSTNRKQGPYLNTDISTNKPPKIEAQGFVKVFGISVETRLLVTSRKYEFEITGKFLNLFEARLLIAAQYSKSITSGKFLVEGWFKNDLFDKIAAAVRNGLKKSADEADKHIKNAQNKIRAAQGKLDAAVAKLEKAKRDIDGAQRKFDDAIAKVNGARRKVDGICSYKSCGSGTVLGVLLSMVVLSI